MHSNGKTTFLFVRSLVTWVGTFVPCTSVPYLGEHILPSPEVRRHFSVRNNAWDAQRGVRSGREASETGNGL